MEEKSSEWGPHELKQRGPAKGRLFSGYWRALITSVHTWNAFGSASMLAPRMVLLRLMTAEAEDATPGGSGTIPMSGEFSDMLKS